MNIQKDPRIKGVQVISRAAMILRLLGQRTDGLSLGQIATAVDLPRSTVQRIVNALADEGFVSTGSGSGTIRLGAEIQSLAQATTTTPADRLRPAMQQIANSTGETVDLAVLQNGQMLFVDQIVGSQRLRTVSSIGERFPLTTTANGKAALACLDEHEATRLVLSELQSSGDDRKLAPLLAEIDGIRGGDLAVDEDEHTNGISALGFGITDPSGEVFAISVPVPSSRFAQVRDCLVQAMKIAQASANAR